MFVQTMLTRLRRPSFLSVSLALPIALVLTGACGGSPPPPPKKPAPESMEPEPEDFGEMDPEPIETGKDCLTATTECGGGVCIANVKNDCDEPVTCELEIMASCRAGTSSGEARTKSRATFRGKSEDKMSAAGDCADGEVVFTVAEGMSCK